LVAILRGFLLHGDRDYQSKNNKKWFAMRQCRLYNSGVEKETFHRRGNIVERWGGGVVTITLLTDYELRFTVVGENTHGYGGLLSRT
jgi:hypothetical protein